VVAWVMFGKTASGGMFMDDGLSSGDSRLTIAAIVALMMLFASFYTEKMMLSSSRLEDCIKRNPQVSDIFPKGQNGASKNDPALEGVYQNLPESEKRLAALGAQYQTALIVVWALREGVVVVGLVAAIMCESFSAVLPFAAVSMIGLGLKVPRPTSFFEKNLNLVKSFV